jgi:hypothetical protein
MPDFKLTQMLLPPYQSPVTPEPFGELTANHPHAELCGSPFSVGHGSLFALEACDLFPPSFQGAHEPFAGSFNELDAIFPIVP